MVISAYAKGFSERIAKVLRGFSIKVVHKPIRTITNILKNQKTRSRKRLSEESCTSARRIKPDNIFVKEDLSPVTLEKRESQRPKLEAAKRAGKIAYFVLDKLVIRDIYIYIYI